MKIARAKAVAQGSGHEQQGREDERVGVDDPSEAGDVGGEARAQCIKCDVDDTDVKKNDHKAKRRGGKRYTWVYGARDRHRDNLTTLRR